MTAPVLFLDELVLDDQANVIGVRDALPPTTDQKDRP